MSDQNSQKKFQKKFMEIALEAAYEAGCEGEVPVAALVVDAGGMQIALCQNRIERDRDPTAHAEMLAIREGLRERRRMEDVPSARWLEGCSLYVTLEPCSMCAAAIVLARFRRLFFAAYDSKCGGVERGGALLGGGKMEVYGGIDGRRAEEMLREFFRARRA